MSSTDQEHSSSSDEEESSSDEQHSPKSPSSSPNPPPRILIIGAGSRGKHYSRAICESSNGVVAAVAEPVHYKRHFLGSRYIWGEGKLPRAGQQFISWRDFLAYETDRRSCAQRGKKVLAGVDAVFVCVQDEMHREVVVGLAPLGLHIMCEKPLATSLADCLDIWRAVGQNSIFSIGHVLRYSPHNMMLRKLLVEDRVIGDVLSVNHTEPVGWWHFTHSYVRYVAFLTPAQRRLTLSVQGKLAQGIDLGALTAHQVLS